MGGRTQQLSELSRTLLFVCARARAPFALTPSTVTMRYVCTLALAPWLCRSARTHTRQRQIIANIRIIENSRAQCHDDNSSDDHKDDACETAVGVFFVCASAAARGGASTIRPPKCAPFTSAEFALPADAGDNADFNRRLN